jgi:hypothetical protein
MVRGGDHVTLAGNRDSRLGPHADRLVGVDPTADGATVDIVGITRSSN